MFRFLQASNKKAKVDAPVAPVRVSRRRTKGDPPAYFNPAKNLSDRDQLKQVINRMPTKEERRLLPAGDWMPMVALYGNLAMGVRAARCHDPQPGEYWLVEWKTKAGRSLSRHPEAEVAPSTNPTPCPPPFPPHRHCPPFSMFDSGEEGAGVICFAALCSCARASFAAEALDPLTFG